MSLGIASRKDYTADKTLSSGGFGTVSRIRRKNDGAVFAEKIIKLPSSISSQLQSTLDEANTVFRIQHENLVKVFTSFVEDNNFIIIMEYCGQRRDLASAIAHRMQSQKHFREKRIRLWFTFLCHAVSFLHAKGIIHRNITPRNIFLPHHGHMVKLGDSGLAKVLDCFSTESRILSVANFIYMAPEICKGEPYDSKVDIWMLAVVLYELASFKLPFTDNNPFLLMSKIQSSNHPPLDEGLPYSETMKSLIDKMLTKDSTKRPSIEDILNDQFLKEDDVLSSEETTSSGFVPSESLQAPPSPPKEAEPIKESNCSDAASPSRTQYPNHNGKTTTTRRANIEMIKKSKTIPPEFKETILDSMDEHEVTVDRLLDMTSTSLRSLFPQDKIRQAVIAFISEVKRDMGSTEPQSDVNKEERSVNEEHQATSSEERGPGEHMSNSENVRPITTTGPRRHRTESPDPPIRNDNRFAASNARSSRQENESNKPFSPSSSKDETLNRIK